MVQERDLQRSPRLIRLYYLIRGFISVLIALATVAAAAPGQAPSTDLLIQNVENHYNSVRTLSVNFTEDYSLLGHRRPTESGVLTLRKVGKMRWDYRRPEGKLFISDGKTVYLYTSANNRVEKVSLKNTEDMRAPLAFLLGKLAMNKEFRDFSTRTDTEGTWLRASARTDREPYSSVDMQLSSDGSVRHLIVQGRDQSVISYRFENEKINPKIDDATFHFQIPSGAQVVDALEQAGQGPGEGR